MFNFEKQKKKMLQGRSIDAKKAYADNVLRTGVTLTVLSVTFSLGLGVYFLEKIQDAEYSTSYIVPFILFAEILLVVVVLNSAGKKLQKIALDIIDEISKDKAFIKPEKKK